MREGLLLALIYLFIYLFILLSHASGRKIRSVLAALSLNLAASASPLR